MQGGMSAPLLKNAEVLAEHLPVAGRSVLDIGAGSGTLTRLLARRGARVVALEPQIELTLQVAAKPVADERYVAGQGELLPFAAASFDVAIFFNALHHVPVAAMGGALAEALRTLKPAGTLAVLEPVAAGRHFQLMRPLEDETQVRAEAIAALQRLCDAGQVRRRLRLEYDVAVAFADFAEWTQAMVRVDPARGQRLERQRQTLAASFASLAERDEEGRFLFRQPTRFELFAGA